VNKPSSASWDRTINALAESVRDQELPSVSEIARRRRDPFRVLVSTVISLRTKDEVTAAASERLLARAPTPDRLLRLEEEEISSLIFPAGFYRNKAQQLRQIAGILVDTHDSAVPSSMEDLLELPGVGRKTANLVRNLGFGLEGICVDTHVHRISNRMGWVKTRTPDQTEAGLMEHLPRRYWIPINKILVQFGKKICTPVSPHCSKCPIGAECPRHGVERSR
jgi:endonuclease-3